MGEKWKKRIITESRKRDYNMATFIDMFAGAGGFSEGFLQAEKGDKHFDFFQHSSRKDI